MKQENDKVIDDNNNNKNQESISKNIPVSNILVKEKKKQLKLKKNTFDKIFKSASLTFYDKNLGYLLCEEFRYKEKKKLIHPIGGKVESFDKNIFETAIREFIEETNIESHKFFNQKNLGKNELVCELVKMFEKNNSYKDLCINKELNYFHRFYFIKLESNTISIDISSNLYELPIFFNGKFKTEIDSIYWISSENMDIYKNKLSWLTKMFIKKLC